MCLLVAALAAAVVVVSATPARAQLYEDVGTRAQGMAGAFVAVADDATATWWNPAGLATGALFNLVLEKGRVTQPESPTFLSPARRATVTGFALALPSFGASYYRLRVSQIAPISPTESLEQNRQDGGGEVRQVRTLAFNQFGATVGQSLGDHLVLASTFKLVRGGRATAVLDPSTDLLDQGDDLDLTGETHADLDAGVMLAFPGIRAGLSIRNLRRPAFGVGSERVALKRQARAGIAWLAKPGGGLAALTVAADADLTRTMTPFGEVRHVSTGGEAWLVNRRLGLRGGVARNTIGDRRTTTSAGASVAVTKSVYIDGARTFGADKSIRGWSSTLRFTF
jgi:hypothetical protein